MINFVFPGLSRQDVKKKACMLSEELSRRGYNFSAEPGAGEFQDLIAVGLCDLFYDAVYEDGPIYRMSNNDMVLVDHH